LRVEWSGNISPRRLQGQRRAKKQKKDIKKKRAIKPRKLDFFFPVLCPRYENTV
jgi:hypothetical protein